VSGRHLEFLWRVDCVIRYDGLRWAILLWWSCLSVGG
jgi:hypothetical protein